MRIGKVIGNVTLSRGHESLRGGCLLLVTPLSLEQLAGQQGDEHEPFVVYDELGAGLGHRIAISEGVEATMPFAPNYKPLDAYNAAILDDVRIDPAALKPTN